MKRILMPAVLFLGFLCPVSVKPQSKPKVEPECLQGDCGKGYGLYKEANGDLLAGRFVWPSPKKWGYKNKKGPVISFSKSWYLVKFATGAREYPKGDGPAFWNSVSNTHLIIYEQKKYGMYDNPDMGESKGVKIQGIDLLLTVGSMFKSKDFPATESAIKSGCIAGDCKNGVGIFGYIGLLDNDSTSLLYAGDFKEGKFQGNGLLYGIDTKDMWAGDFDKNEFKNGCRLNAAGKSIEFFEGNKKLVQTFMLEYLPGSGATESIEKKELFWREYRKRLNKKVDEDAR